jgi:hypothetical protein
MINAWQQYLCISWDFLPVLKSDSTALIQTQSVCVGSNLQRKRILCILTSASACTCRS